MRIAVVRESRPGEARVALVPESVGKLTALGYEVAVERGAGESADLPDDAYRQAGAIVEPAALDGARVVLSVQPLDMSKAQRRVYGHRSVTAYAMDLIPRISRAQSMDALSSQALVAGYRCAIVAAERLGRFLPLNMTAAGTIPPAQVVVLGAGVAGLQAIATTKRLGAVVKAYDVRAAAAEEIRSMGAQAIELDLETLEGSGGYAREMSEARAARQRELLTPYVAAADALITTAAVPGRPAPRLVTRAMVEQMRPGSVVVDLAAESGGNVEGSVAGEVTRVGGATIWGASNVPSQMPAPASRLYAQNVVNLLTLMTRDGAYAPDFADEIVAGCCVVRDGDVVHAPTRELLAGVRS